MMSRRRFPAACLLIAPLLVGNADPEAEEPGWVLPETLNAPVLQSVTPLEPRNCTDTWETVMEERGQARFRREPASPDSPQMVRAVDYDIDGCDFLVTGTGIQPLPPRPQADAPLLHRTQ